MPDWREVPGGRNSGESTVNRIPGDGRLELGDVNWGSDNPPAGVAEGF